MDGLSSRSNALNYDDADLFRPAWWQRKHNVLSKHVGHEVGHALGQCHIMGLKGMAQYTFSGGRTPTTPRPYGVGSADKFDAWNIMGGGDRIYLINAISWQQRIALHTQRPAERLGCHGCDEHADRTLPFGYSHAGSRAGGMVATRRYRHRRSEGMRARARRAMRRRASPGSRVEPRSGHRHGTKIHALTAAAQILRQKEYRIDRPKVPRRPEIGPLIARLQRGLEMLQEVDLGRSGSEHRHRAASPD
ncbi:MAG: hypothetical protein WDN69_37335 [Aliidongia sp.]